MANIKTAKPKIDYVQWAQHEEEGGSTILTYYPDGRVSVSAVESGRGYVPPIESGWYKIPKVDDVAKIFRYAGDVLKQKPDGDTVEHDPDNFEITRIKADGRELVFSTDVANSLGLNGSILKTLIPIFE